MLTFTTAGGSEVDIVPMLIVSVRDTLGTERPGESVISTLDGKHHIVMEDRATIRRMWEEKISDKAIVA